MIHMKALDFSCKNETEVGYRQIEQRLGEQKAWSLGLESTTVGEKDTEVQKIRAVKDIPTEAFDDTAAEGKKCLCWDWAISMMQRDTLHSREEKHRR